MQVFDMVNHESYNSAPGVNVTGMREDFLQLRIGQETYVCVCLVSSGKEDSSQATDSSSQCQNGEDGVLRSDPLDMMVLDAKHDTRNLLGFPSPVSLEIYLQDMFHRNVVAKVKDKRSFPPRHQLYSQHSGDGNGLLGHFCMTVSHRIFSNRVLSELEYLVESLSHIFKTNMWNSIFHFDRILFMHAGEQGSIPSFVIPPYLAFSDIFLVALFEGSSVDSSFWGTNQVLRFF